MARQQYADRLSSLRTEVVLLAELVLERYEDALQAAADGDLRRADQIVRQDDEINDWYLELEGECIDLIARHQPVAGDLRLITASFKIITDLERIGDLATNLARRTEYGRSGIHPAVDLHALGVAASEMVDAAVAAYEDDDAAACRAVAADDDRLDADCAATTQRIIRELITERTATDRTDDELARAVERTTHALLTVRDIERVGDHAVNIAARTLYMIDGDADLLY
ncbi:phosphate signaling complex protein PhoU [Halonotius terrestris]|uniref:Phosphate-specific transport system accessory protein PhoU n=1 Tax=Halonotius terrestris TaxID=2487750 RepID=A0A8J8TD41_9EURY|nr:phosphate signaling complex protein PhoU [Halonotius terrestris]TQQ82819.1 phosphate signaling complex protein PhoU [Halonotius terrestris]